MFSTTRCPGSAGLQQYLRGSRNLFSDGTQVAQMPEPEPQGVTLKPEQETPSEIVPEEAAKVEKGVSWQDGVDGKSLYTVREFEPSETAFSDDDERWDQTRTCCTIT